MRHVVCVKLFAVGADYAPLFKSIQKVATNFVQLESAWFVECDLSANALFNELSRYTTEGDELIVCPIDSHSRAEFKASAENEKLVREKFG